MVAGWTLVSGPGVNRCGEQPRSWPAPADLPGAPSPRPGPAQGIYRDGCAALLDAAHQQLGGPLVLVWDNLNTHVSAAMKELIAARDWLTVAQRIHGRHTRCSRSASQLWNASIGQPSSWTSR
jgi:hypothetical protein